MNKKLLLKILDELNKDKPDISYIKGILETMLVADEPVSLPINPITPHTVPAWPGDTPVNPFPNFNPPYIATNETKTDTPEPSVSEAGMMGKVDLSAIQTG